MKHITGPHINPFEFGRELGAAELVDRESEVDAVIRTIQARGRLFLIGPRRFGKTSVLRVASDKASELGAVVLRFNVEAYSNLQVLAQAISGEAAGRLTGSAEKAGEKVRRFFGALRPEFSYDPLAGTFAMSFGTHRPDDEEALLAEVLTGVNGLARDSGRVVAIILDEFQQVVESGGVRAESQVRAAVQEHDSLAYVFAGSKTRLLTEMTGDHNRPFYRLGERLFLGPIPRTDFRAFLSESFSRTGRRIRDDAAEHILDLCLDVPYNVQRLAHACWYAAPGRESAFQPEDVEQQLEILVRRDDPFYTQTWNSLSRNQQKALLAAVQEDDQLFSRSSLARYDIAQSSLSVALKSLVDRGVLRTSESGGAMRFVLEDPFFAVWLRLFIVTA
ncbi:MAG: AAA+ ATPase superfamily predicted ATPase [Rhodothermales bacterium]|jgi:AAA+ ATPase superfamily predicted ATPase